MCEDEHDLNIWTTIVQINLIRHLTGCTHTFTIQTGNLNTNNVKTGRNIIIII